MASKVELTLASGAKIKLSEMCAGQRALLVITLKPDTPLCNKQLRVVEEMLEEGVLADKCKPIGVVVGTLNEIEQWENKMLLKYPVVQGTPEFLELLGCCSRGKVKRSCILLGADDKVEFADMAVKSGTSFVPKLKEYLESVKPIPVAPIKAAAAPRGKKATAKAAVKTPTAVAPVEAPPVKLKVTRKSAVAATDEKKRVVAVKKAQAKKKATPTEKRVTTGEIETSAMISTSTPGEGDEALRTAGAELLTSAIKSKSASTKSKSKVANAASKTKKRAEPNSDIESPPAALAVDATVEAPSQARQRKRIKIVS